MSVCGTPYRYEVCLILDVQDWPLEQDRRVADELQEIKGWRAGGTSPRHITYFYDARVTTDESLARSVQTVLERARLSEPMMNIFTRWRVEFPLQAAPPQGRRFRLTRLIRGLPRVGEAYFDHREFRAVSVLIDDEPTETTMSAIHAILGPYL